MNDNEKTHAPARADAGDGPVPAARGCPICRKPAVAAFRPFCSKRCADLDLSRWLNGVYAVPARETDEDDDDQAR